MRWNVSRISQPQINGKKYSGIRERCAGAPPGDIRFVLCLYFGYFIPPNNVQLIFIHKSKLLMEWIWDKCSCGQMKINLLMAYTTASNNTKQAIAVCVCVCDVEWVQWASSRNVVCVCLCGVSIMCCECENELWMIRGWFGNGVDGMDGVWGPKYKGNECFDIINFTFYNIYSIYSIPSVSHRAQLKSNIRFNLQFFFCLFLVLLKQKTQLKSMKHLSNTQTRNEDLC